MTTTVISAAECPEHDGLALAALVQRGEVGAAELLAAVIARADAMNPAINAIVIPMHVGARPRARRGSGA